MDTFNAQISDLGRPAQRVLTGVNFEENRIRLEGQKPFDTADAYSHRTNQSNVFESLGHLADGSWICAAPERNYFWTTNGHDTAISTYQFREATDNTKQDSFKFLAIHNSLENHDNIAGDSIGGFDDWVFLELSDDGQWLYQMFGVSGVVAVYEVKGYKLDLVEVLHKS